MIIIIKRPISSLKIENECTDFQNTVSPEAVPSLPPCDPTPVLVAGSAWRSAPAERDVPRAVASLLHQRFVELAAGSGVDAGPAVFTVVLQTGDVGTEEWGKLPTAARALALVTHLVVQHIRFHFHLDRRGDRRQGSAKASLTRLQSRSCVGSAPFFTSLCALPAPWSVGAQPHTELCSHTSWGQTTAQGKGCFRKAYKPKKVGPHQACQGDRRLKGGLGLLLWWKAFQTVPGISWTPGTAGVWGGGQETCWALLIWTGLITLFSASLEAGTEGSTALQGAFNRPSETKLHDMKPFQSQRKHMLVRVSLSQSLEKKLDCEFLCFEHQE